MVRPEPVTLQYKSNGYPVDVRRLRRTLDEPRLEIMPLVDVIFLLLTFFVFAMALMVRADVLNVSLPRIGAGEPLEQSKLITVGLDADGNVFVNGELAAIEELGATVQDLIARGAEAGAPPRVVIAADEAGTSGQLLHVLDALSATGVQNVAVMGRPAKKPTEQQP